MYSLLIFVTNCFKIFLSIYRCKIIKTKRKTIYIRNKRNSNGGFLFIQIINEHVMRNFYNETK